jgi:class 3 adenylate cyclase/pimeloyl-ACP methyl ester carboxylesterase
MTSHPTTQYVRSGDLHIAYQVIGDGPVDLVEVLGATTHLEATWDEPLIAQYYERLASFCRLIRFDQRGVGMSDPVPSSALPTLEERVDDLRAVLDAAGSERPVLFGDTEGGPPTVLFAATDPERTAGLVLYSTYACLLQSPNHPHGWPAEAVEEWLEALQGRWGTGVGLRLLAPSLAQGPFRERWARFERLANSPGQFAALTRMAMASDVRHVLPTISVPTLVLHRRDNALIPVDLGQELAEGIPGSTYIELPGADHFPFAGDTEALVGEIEEFVTGTRRSPVGERVLSTVLFTDIAGSTALAANMGDQAWKALLDAHNDLVRRQLTRYRGNEVKTTGDGFLATFDGPARAIRCADAIREGARRLGLDIRAGVHTGEIEVRGNDVAGIAVHIASRVASCAQPGQVLVSHAVPPLVVGASIEFAEVGQRELKGVPGDWTLYAAEPP